MACMFIHPYVLSAMAAAAAGGGGAGPGGSRGDEGDRSGGDTPNGRGKERWRGLALGAALVLAAILVAVAAAVPLTTGRSPADPTDVRASAEAEGRGGDDDGNARNPGLPTAAHDSAHHAPTSSPSSERNATDGKANHDGEDAFVFVSNDEDPYTFAVQDVASPPSPSAQAPAETSGPSSPTDSASEEVGEWRPPRASPAPAAVGPSSYNAQPAVGPSSYNAQPAPPTPPPTVSATMRHPLISSFAPSGILHCQAFTTLLLFSRHRFFSDPPRTARQ